MVESMDLAMSWRGDPKPDLGLSSDGTMEDGRGARHPVNKPNTRSCLNRRVITKPEKKPQPAYHAMNPYTPSCHLVLDFGLIII